MINKISLKSAFASGALRIGVFRPRPEEDLVVCGPALRALRGKFPKARITMIGLPGARSLYSRVRHWVDQFNDFPGFPGVEPVGDLSGAWPQRLESFYRECQRLKFDVLVQMHGADSITNAFCESLGARFIVGHYREGQYRPSSPYFREYRESESEVLRCLKLMQVLGVDATASTQMEFPILEKDLLDAQKVLDDCGVGKSSYVCLHPSANDLGDCWPLPFFAVVANALWWSGYRVLITGKAEDAPISRALALTMKAPSVDLARLRVPFETQAALIKGAKLVVANESFASTLSAALGIPSVVVLMGKSSVAGSFATRLAPMNPFLHRVLCSPFGVHPDEVYSSAKRLLNLPGASVITQQTGSPL